MIQERCKNFFLESDFCMQDDEENSLLFLTSDDFDLVRQPLVTSDDSDFGNLPSRTGEKFLQHSSINQEVLVYGDYSQESSKVMEEVDSTKQNAEVLNSNDVSEPLLAEKIAYQLLSPFVPRASAYHELNRFIEYDMRRQLSRKEENVVKKNILQWHQVKEIGVFVKPARGNVPFTELFPNILTSKPYKYCVKIVYPSSIGNLRWRVYLHKFVTLEDKVEDLERKNSPSDRNLVKVEDVKISEVKKKNMRMAGQKFEKLMLIQFPKTSRHLRAMFKLCVEERNSKVLVFESSVIKVVSRKSSEEKRFWKAVAGVEDPIPTEKVKTKMLKIDTSIMIPPPPPPPPEMSPLSSNGSIGGSRMGVLKKKKKGVLKNSQEHLKNFLKRSKKKKTRRRVQYEKDDDYIPPLEMITQFKGSNNHGNVSSNNIPQFRTDRHCEKEYVLASSSKKKRKRNRNYDVFGEYNSKIPFIKTSKRRKMD